MDIQQFILELEKNYERVRNFLGHSTDIRITLGIATKYTLAGKTYSGMAYERQLNEVKEMINQKRWYEINDFSITSINTYRLATHILLHKDPEAYMQKLWKSEKRLQKVGFKKSPYRSIAALILSENVSHETIAKQLYDEMRKKHQFLTGKDDIPYAVLVTSDLNKDVVTRAQTMYQYYNRLKQNGFKKGDALQALTQILSIHNVFYDETIAQYSTHLKKEFEMRDIKVKKTHYPYIGILALVMCDTTLVEKIVANYKRLLATQMLKREASYAFTIAIQWTIQQLDQLNDMIYVKESHNIIELLEIVDLTVDITSFLLDGISTFFPFDFPN